MVMIIFIARRQQRVNIVQHNLSIISPVEYKKVRMGIYRIASPRVEQCSTLQTITESIVYVQCAYVCVEINMGFLQVYVNHVIPNGHK